MPLKSASAGVVIPRMDGEKDEVACYTKGGAKPVRQGPGRMLLCVLVVVLLGIVYMGLEYGKEEAVLRVSGSEGTAGAVTVEGEEAPGNVKGRKRKLRYAKPLKFGAAQGSLSTSAVGLGSNSGIKPPRVGYGLPQLPWRPDAADVLREEGPRKGQWGDHLQEVEVTAADGRQGQADEEGEVEEVGEEELEELEDAVEKEEIAEEEEKERAARDAEKERDSQPGPSALQQQQTEGAQQQATLGKEPPGGGAARPGRSGGRPGRSTGRLKRGGISMAPVPYGDDAIRKAAKALDLELMRGAPRIRQQFHTELRNPCWTDKSGAGRCLPAFYILGSFQAGVWNLFSSLAAHPQVLSGNFNARPHFWAETGKSMEDYVGGYSTPAVMEALRKDPGALLGDASASTFAFYWAAGQRLHSAFRTAMQPCWKNCTSGPKEEMHSCMDSTCFPKAQAADREAVAAAGISYRFAQLPLLMKAVYGSRPPRLIAILRDPAERLHHAFWSHPHYRDKYGATAEGFLSYAKETVQEFRACESSSGPVRCALYFEALGQRQEDVFFHCDQLIRGMYSVFLESWIAYFGREAVLVLKGEEYYADPLPSLRLAAAHLGIHNPEDPEILQRMRAAGEAERTRTMSGKPGMLPEARSLLREFYSDWNDRLAFLLRDRRFLWAETQPRRL